MTTQQTIFEAIGGFKAIDEIIEGMYKRVAVHPELIPIFPEDLEESARKQRLFLIQFFGGPQLYNEERGHPMLRRRHLPFEITPARRDAWLACMKASLEESSLDESHQQLIYERLKIPAAHMVNTSE
ncbi:MAG TPA: globin [Virgibacillus sp.]|nr:globin [Virgibacillus sp.]